MKYVSLDLETTGLDPQRDQILQISMVVDDLQDRKPLTALPHYTAFVNPGRIEGDAFALGMNSWILDIISGRDKNNTGYPVIPPSWLTSSIRLGPLGFLIDYFGDEKITVAGKCVEGFDIPFLPIELRRRFSHKTLDPGSMFMRPEDNQVPGLEECLRRAGLPDKVTHDAYSDAIQVVQLIRHFVDNIKTL